MLPKFNPIIDRKTDPKDINAVVLYEGRKRLNEIDLAPKRIEEKKKADSIRRRLEKYNMVPISSLNHRHDYFYYKGISKEAIMRSSDMMDSVRKYGQ